MNVGGELWIQVHHLILTLAAVDRNVHPQWSGRPASSVGLESPFQPYINRIGLKRNVEPRNT